MAEHTDATVRVTVRLFAGARAAAGTSEAVLDVTGGVQDVLDALVRDHPGVARVLPACSYLLDGVAARPGQDLGATGPLTLDVLPPFSGG